MSAPHKTNPRSSSSSRTPNDILLHNTRHANAASKQNQQRIATTSDRSNVKSTKLKNILVNGREQEQLMKACGEGDIEKVRYLLTNTKPQLNPDLIRDTKLRSPLLVACASGHAEMVRLLVKFGADVNNPVGDIVGNRPMDLAVVANDFDTVLTLLELGATVQRPGLIKPSTSPSSQQSTGMDPDESKYPPPIPHRIGRTPLDLAQSRLDLLARNDQSSGGEVLAQVIKIIDLLKFFVKGAPSTHNPTTQSTTTENSNTIQELDNLTTAFSSIAFQENNRFQEKDLIKDLGDMISRLQL